MENGTVRLRKRVGHFVPKTRECVSDMIELKILLQEVVDNVYEVEERLAALEYRTRTLGEELRLGEHNLQVRFKRLQDWLTDYVETR